MHVSSVIKLLLSTSSLPILCGSSNYAFIPTFFLFMPYCMPKPLSLSLYVINYVSPKTHPVSYCDVPDFYPVSFSHKKFVAVPCTLHFHASEPCIVTPWITDLYILVLLELLLFLSRSSELSVVLHSFCKNYP